MRGAVYSILFFVTISGLLASFLLYTFAEPLATFGFKEPEAAYFIKAGSLLIILNFLEPVSLFYFRVFRQIKKFSYFTSLKRWGNYFLSCSSQNGIWTYWSNSSHITGTEHHNFNRFFDYHITDKIYYPLFTYIKEYL